MLEMDERLNMPFRRSLHFSTSKASLEVVRNSLRYAFDN